MPTRRRPPEPPKPLLSAPLSLGGVENIEALCEKVLMRLWRRYGARLMVEHEDALAELVGEAWRLHRDWWDPERNPSFASAASWKLHCWGVDRFLRTQLGRKGEKIPPGGFVESLDGQWNLDPEDTPDRRRGEAGLEAAVERERGAEPERSLDLIAILSDRSSEVLAARRAVVIEGAMPKGVARLLDELRAELAA